MHPDAEDADSDAPRPGRRYSEEAEFRRMLEKAERTRASTEGCWGSAGARGG